VTIEEYLGDHPFFVGLDRDALALAARCARHVHFRPGDLLFREGEPANAFYVLRRGRVALEMRTGTGSRLLDTVDADDADNVVGWSWLVPPYRWTFDARAVTGTSAIAFDGACLRDRCEADPALGYALLQRVVRVMSARLHSARVRLLDLYGDSP
jgi:CRP-like cAMP-binding protein